MTTPPPRKLLDVVREVIRLKHYSYRTEQTYIDWIKRYLLYHDKKHPREMGTQEIQDFLTHLAVNRQVAASTQNQALSALLFLDRDVLKIELGKISEFMRAKRPKRLPTVIPKDEVTAVIGIKNSELRIQNYPLLKPWDCYKESCSFLSYLKTWACILPKGSQISGQTVWNRKKNQLPLFGIVSLPTSCKMAMTSHRTGIIGTQGREDDDDLHSCLESRGERSKKSSRFLIE